MTIDDSICITHVTIAQLIFKYKEKFVWMRPWCIKKKQMKKSSYPEKHIYFQNSIVPPRYNYQNVAAVSKVDFCTENV